MSEHENTRVAERLFSEVWGDPEGTIPDDLIHEEFWSSEPGVASLNIGPDGKLEASHAGVEALEREVAVYRDFYRDFMLEIIETFETRSTGKGDVASWEDDRMQGETVVVIWKAAATHPTATFTTRGGDQAPLRVGGRGVSVVRIVDRRIRSADKYWESDSEVQTLMTDDVAAPSRPQPPEA